MADEPTSLNEARALRANDNSLWSSRDCAEAFLRDIKSGEIKPKRVLIIYEEPTEDGGSTIATYAANLPRDQEIVLLHLRLHNATHKWEKR